MNEQWVDQLTELEALNALGHLQVQSMNQLYTVIHIQVAVVIMVMIFMRIWKRGKDK